MSSYGDRLALDSADFKVFIDSSTYEYTGDTISPEVSVFVVNGSALTSGIDFEVIYLNNIAPSRAAISVNGLGIMLAFSRGFRFKLFVPLTIASLFLVLGPIKMANCG